MFSTTNYEKVFDIITPTLKSQNLVLVTIISINGSLFYNNIYIYIYTLSRLKYFTHFNTTKLTCTNCVIY